MSSTIVSANIRDRRTVKPKGLSDRPIEDPIIEEILENANWAPTHGLTEPWRFVIFTGDARKELGRVLSEIYREVTDPDSFKASKFEGYSTNPSRAPVVMAVVMKRQESRKISELDEIQAVACAVQNMHLTAASHGLGAFYSTNAPAVSDQMRSFLGFESPDKVLGLFYLGYPIGGWPESTRTPIANKVTWRRD